MDLLRTDIFSMAEKRLGWLDKRQELLSRNVANADTPGWRAKDLTPFAATLSAFANGPTVARTQPLHLVGTLDSGPAGVTASPVQVAPDGNSVVIEDELVKVADTQGTQALVTNLYTKYMGFFRLAFGQAGA